MTDSDLATWTAIRGTVQYDWPGGPMKHRALDLLDKIEAELSQLRRERDEARAEAQEYAAQLSAARDGEQTWQSIAKLFSAGYRRKP